MATTTAWLLKQLQTAWVTDSAKLQKYYDGMMNSTLPQDQKDMFKEAYGTYTSGLNKTTATPSTTPVTGTQAITNKYSAMNTLWTTTAWNIHVDKLKDTWAAYETQVKTAAADKSAALKAWWQEESALTKASQEAARKRYADQQAELQANKATATKRADDRRSDANEILKRQESIAARQANIAAWQAWSSWLQMSAWAMQDITDDVINKYGSNLSSAEQFKNQTKMTLDTALNQIDSETFKNKQAIDSFINTLDDNELKPLINAVQKATEWNVQAIEDVKTYYTALTQKKADEEYKRMSEFERLSDSQTQWVALDQTQKWAKLSDDLKDVAYVMNDYWANPSKYANMSFEEAKSTLKWIADKMANSSNNQALTQYMTNKAQAQASKLPFTEIPAFEKMLQDLNAQQTAVAQTWETKAAARWTTWTSTKELVDSASWLSTANQELVKKAVAKVWKDKAIEAVQKSTSSQASKDKVIAYINSIA